MDALVFPIWVGCTILLGLAAWKLARFWFPADLPLPLVMHTLVLSWAAIVAVAFVLGVAGFLAGWPLMLGVALVSTAALLFLRFSNKEPAPPLPALDPSLDYGRLAKIPHRLGHPSLSLPGDCSLVAGRQPLRPGLLLVEQPRQQRDHWPLAYRPPIPAIS